MQQLVVIPVYNERSTVVSVVNELRQNYTHEILLVDDGSSDGSCDQIELKQIPGLVIIRHSTNRGYGAALITGFDYAIKQNIDYVVTMDCDEQHEPARVQEFFNQISAGNWEIVSGTRYLSCCMQVDTPPEDRVKINRLITEQLNQLFNWQLTDAFCGYKAYTANLLRQLKLTEPGYAMPLQLWVQAGAMGARITELAVPRIYKNLNRSFGAALDNPEVRLQYYQQIIAQELSANKMLCA